MRSKVFITTTTFFFFLSFFIFIPPQSSADEVTIYRDNFGVPHIYSGTSRGLFYGLGYAMAQDRLFQLESFKRAFSSRLAEVFGSFCLYPDYMFTFCGYTQDELQGLYDSLDEEYKTVYSSFTDGINAYIDEALADRENKLPIEFQTYGFDPESWTVLDTALLTVQIMKKPFGGYETTAASILSDLIETHGEEEGNAIFDDLIWIDDPGSPTSIPSSSKAQSQGNPKKTKTWVNRKPIRGIEKVARELRDKQDEFNTALKLLGIPINFDCMALAISPSRSVTRNALLFGGPQEELSIPSIFYEVGLHGAGFDIVGIAGVGMPAMFYGVSRDCAYLWTGGVGNSEDIFVEKLNPENTNQYWYNGEWKDMEVRTFTINVKDSAPVTKTIYYTVHGPITTKDIENLVAYSVKWANRDNPFGIFTSYYEAMKAKDVWQLEKAAKLFSPSGTFTGVDREGNIGFFYVGMYQIEAEGVDNRLPVPGTGEYEWQGFTPEHELPSLINPEQGYLTTWNSKPIAGWEQGDCQLMIPWGPDQRLYRFNEIMKEKKLFSFDDLKEINRDIAMKDLRFSWFKPYLLSAESKKVKDSRIKKAKSYVKSWNGYREDLDGDGYYDSVGLTIFDAWMNRALQNTFEDELGEYWTYVSPSSDGIYEHGAALFLRALQGKKAALPPSRDYFNGEKNEVLLKSLVEALDELETEFGTSDMSAWKREITKMHYEPSFMGLPTSDSSCEITPIYMERPLADYCIEMTNPFPKGVNTCTPGESGFTKMDGTMSEHICDQIELQENWEYKDLLLRFSDVKKNAAEVIKLTY